MKLSYLLSRLLVCLLLACISLPMQGQKGPEEQVVVKKKVVKKKATKSYHLKNKGVIYQIRIGVFSRKIKLKDFDNLKALGVVTTKSIAHDKAPLKYGQTAVYVGQYLDETTAKHMLRKASKMGYKGAILEKDTYTLQHSTGKYLNQSIQIGYVRQLDIDRYLKYSKLLRDNGDIYIHYAGNGRYRILFGLYSPKMASYVNNEVLPRLDKNGVKAFLKKIK